MRCLPVCPRCLYRAELLAVIQGSKLPPKMSDGMLDFLESYKGAVRPTYGPSLTSFTSTSRGLGPQCCQKHAHA